MKLRFISSRLQLLRPRAANRAARTQQMAVTQSGAGRPRPQAAGLKQTSDWPPPRATLPACCAFLVGATGVPLPPQLFLPSSRRARALLCAISPDRPFRSLCLESLPPASSPLHSSPHTNAGRAPRLSIICCSLVVMTLLSLKVTNSSDLRWTFKDLQNRAPAYLWANQFPSQSRPLSWFSLNVTKISGERNSQPVSVFVRLSSSLPCPRAGPSLPPRLGR